MRSRVGAAIGGMAVVVAAFLVSTFQPEPTIIDRFLPLVIFCIWWLAVSVSGERSRELATLLAPLVLAIAVSVPGADLRMLLYGLAVAVAAGSYLRSSAGDGGAAELVAAAALVAPTRIVDATPRNLIVQAIFVVGAVALWHVLRRAQPPLTVAALVLLVSVSVPAVPAKLALVPLGLAGLAWVLQRKARVAGVAVVFLSFLVARWLAAAAALTMVASYGMHWWTGRRARVAMATPLFPAAPNVPPVLLPAAFFPSTLLSVHGAVVFLSTVALAALVRPSLAAPVAIAGLVASGAVAQREPRAAREFELPALALTGTILLFFPWSGALLPRPPAPLPAIIVLAVAALALLPAVFRAWAGVPALAVAILALSVTPHTTPLAHPGRQLAAGQSLALPIPADVAADRLEVTIAGVNLETAAAGRRIAVIEGLDGEGRGFRRQVRLGEVSDWGAFRPPLVLRTSNPRPDRVRAIEGYGLGASVSGAGTITIEAERPLRVLVISPGSDLSDGEEIIIEEVRYR